MGERSPPPLPADQAQRDRIVQDLGSTLFVEAGAGSGKTRSLVDRIVALVCDGGVAMRVIAAITFTDKAASELRDRVRRVLEGVAKSAGGERRGRAAAALLELDGAAVCTLHAFAQRLLTEHPLAARLPPRVEVADEVASQLAFEQRWATFVDALLDEDALATEPADEQALLLLLAVRRPLEALRDVVLEFERNWDLVAEHVAHQSAPPLDLLDVRPIVDCLRAVADERCHGHADDRLVAVLAQIDDFARALEGASACPDQLAALHRLGALKVRRVGNQTNWRLGPWAGALDELRTEADHALERCRVAERELCEAALRRLAARLASFTLAAAEERRREGRLVFHDLLVLARALLRDPVGGEALRAVLHERYARVLLDEFQDTDPIQVEIATLLAADPAAPVDGARRASPQPGRLFFVGDPKQSIYRFRRADIGTFLATRDAVTDDPVQLTANFRTRAPLIAWVNAVFGRLITAEPGAQPPYLPLHAERHVDLAGPGVVVFDVEHDDGPSAAALRSREVGDVVAALQQALAGWQVADEVTGSPRPVRAGDVAILIPSRTVLDTLEEALDAADLPYRTESSSLAYASREVRDLLLAVRAIDDPTDELALISALRSPLFGCSDLDLYRWRRERGGRWSLVGGTLAPPEPDDAVHDALTYLRQLAAERHWLAPAELLDRLVRDRRVLEVAGRGRRARDVWRRVRYVLDQARAWREAGGGTLREYVAWAYRQAADSVRVTEAVLPEQDHDAVRVMTIHAAKGLEFPVVVVAGLTTQHRGGRAGVDVLWTRHGPELRLDPSFHTREYETERVLDEQLDEHERRRLLYVVRTRARDHLVVSAHRKIRKGEGGRRTLAELVAEAATDDELHTTLDAPVPAPAGAGEAPARRPPIDLARWRTEHAEVVGRAGRPRTVAATALAEHAEPELRAEDDPGLAKGGVDLDRPPWQKGRYGTAIGRAVHAVLQTVDLATGAGVDEAAAAQAAAEGVLGRERTIAALARSALASATVAEAVAAPARWREVLVVAPFGETSLEGYLDLLFRTPEGLVVVDYKTDQVSDADLEARVERYRVQLAAYAAAVVEVTGEPVVRAMLVFCSPDAPAREREVPRLAEAMAAVASQLAGATGAPPPALPV